MAETSTHEPTMEEILASIRRIISEDDTPEEVSAKPEPEPEPEIEPEPEAFMATEPEEVVEDEIEEDVLELTEVTSPPAQSLGDLDIYDAPAPAAKPEPRHEPKIVIPTEPITPKAPLVSDITASTAASAFGALNSALLMPKSGHTLEDFMKDMMRPMLQTWLDANLPSIVEEQVRLEVERISRQSRT